MKKPRLPFVVAGIVGGIVLVGFIRRHDPGFCVVPAPKSVDATLEAGHPPVSKSEACGKALEQRPNAVTVGGEKRTFELVLPEPYEADHPYPLVLYFHGNGGSAEQARADNPFPGTIAVYPQAVVRRVWADHFAPHWGKVEDLPLFDTLVETVEKSLCVDRARVFAVGWSAGGYFANQLACVRPKVVTAFFAFASGGPEDAVCTDPVPGFIHHDRDDHAVLLTEGQSSRDKWQKTNRCPGSSHTEGACTVYEGCAAPLLYCETSGNHHAVPPSVLESTRRSIARF